MKYNFDEAVDRTGFSSVKQAMTPAEITDSGIMSMWGAEFEFPTAPFVTEAVVRWARKGLYAYTVDDGGFRKLVRDWMKAQRNWEIEDGWIVPVYGITSSLAMCVRAFTEPGDGVIGMVPGYHMYWEAIGLSGRRKVASELIYRDRRYEIDWEDLERKMSRRENKILVLCNPHNPVARVWNRGELARIAELAVKYDVIIFSDEIFAECIYDGVEMLTVRQASPLAAKVIVATSLGKWLSFTGTNQANLIIEDETLRQAVVEERDREFYGSMNPMMLPAYRAAYTEEGRIWLKEMMGYVQENYRTVDGFFRENVPEFRAVQPEGTYILWVDASAWKPEGKTLQEFLVHDAHFHVDPGEVYGGKEGFFRMTLSLPRKEIEKALCSLGDACRKERRAKNRPA